MFLFFFQHFNQIKIARTLWVGLDYPEVKDCLSPQLITLLQSNPDVALSCFGLALYKLLHTRAPDLWIENRPIMPRLYGFEPITPLRNVKSNLLGTEREMNGKKEKHQMKEMKEK